MTTPILTISLLKGARGLIVLLCLFHVPQYGGR